MVPGTPIYQRTLEGFSARSIARRTAMGFDPPVTQLDRPFDEDRLALLALAGVRLGAELRWRNSIIVECDPVQAAMVRAMPFVRNLLPVASDLGTLTLEPCIAPNRGNSNTQLDLLNILPLHDAGVYGKGALVGMLDNGFRWRSHPSLRLTDVAGEWDVIYNDSLTANEDGDPDDQDGHGTLVMSVAAAWAPGELIGVAPSASYLLAKSEDMRHERRIEDVHFAAAVEWLERSGADIVSASVGYRFLDSTDVSIPFEALNGASTFSAQAVNQAARFGVLCVVAGGNSGPGARTIATPADADSAITVGAITVLANTARFTSRGPTADGRNKPDVLAPGLPVFVAGLGSTPYLNTTGTSVATPMISGALALLKSMFPEAKPWELRNALYRSVRVTKDSIVPFPWTGYPDVTAAARSLGPFIATPAYVQTPEGFDVVIPVIAGTGHSLVATLRAGDGSTVPLTCTQMDDIWWTCSLPPGVEAEAVRAEVQHNGRSATWANEWWLVPASTTVPCGARLPNTLVSAPSEPHTNVVRAEPRVVYGGRQTVTVLGVGGQRNHAQWVEAASGKIVEATWRTSTGNVLFVNVPSVTGAYVLSVIDDAGTRHAFPILVLP